MQTTVLDVSTLPPAENTLADRVILVTGAGDGIGAALAETLAAQGATVILLGRTTAKLESVYDRIEAACHPQPAIYPMNLEGAAPKDYDDLAATLQESFGRLDGLVHNAAVLPPLGPMEMTPIESWYQAIQINLNAPFLLTRACMDLLRASDQGRLLFTLDQATLTAKAYWGVYGVSKAGLQNLATGIADELENAAGPKVISVLPPPTRTALRRRAFPGEDDSRLPAPADLGRGYVELLGAAAGRYHGKLMQLQL
ncbi:MAG: SDR family NAD(P)-dependent oxidoreductase [Chromatiales bacterium]|nr:SDR family NAD(P)-dependent oxidoreductase [Chromatiales bacterium]